MFYNIALSFTTVSYGHKRLYNIKHRWCWQMFRFLGCFKASRWASLVVVLHLRWNASFADFQQQKGTKYLFRERKNGAPNKSTISSKFCLFMATYCTNTTKAEGILCHSLHLLRRSSEASEQRLETKKGKKKL